MELSPHAQHGTHEFITSLPNGDTLIAERCSSLSGRQVQRLALARVLLKNPPIVLPDEATSALGSKSESKMQEPISPLLENRAYLVITHRKSTVEAAHSRR